MHSVRTRILALALGCVLLSNLIVIFVGIIGVSGTVNDDSSQVIQELAQHKAQEVDKQLLLVEQSVQTLHAYIAQEVSRNPSFWQNTDELAQHLDTVRSMAGLAIQSTTQAKSVYYHLAPQIGMADSGVYIVQMGDEVYSDFPLSDANAYGESGRLEDALESGKGAWLLPYRNEAAGKDVISYVIPVIHGAQQIGVVGMDIDLSGIRSMLTVVKGYTGSYAVLMDAAGDFVYHPDYPSGVAAANFSDSYDKISDTMAKARQTEKVCAYRWEGEQRKITFRKLENGMSVGVSVPLTQVRKPARVFALVALIIVAVVILVAYILTEKLSAYIVKPLQELTEVAEKLAGGDLDVNIRCQTNHDELEVLAESLQKTADELKKQVSSVNEFARTDSLTTVHNKSAYQEQIKALTEDIEMDRAQFSVAVLDVNSLKHMNDTYGHEAGDLWITGAATAMERAFGRSRVYRIGGDEFAVIFEPKGRKHYDRMMTEFYKEIDRFNNRDDKIYKEKLQVACGLADYDKSIDRQYADVFRRADDEMYKNKKFLKGLA
ncbi:MAG: diguanylate cyclase [Blautia sp.]|nr:diguanylate cyclase [Blautia sp.]